MSHCLIFCEGDEQAEYIRENLHEPLRKLVRKSGWYISVHAHNKDDLMCWLFQNYPNQHIRYRFDGVFRNMTDLLIRVEKKFHELTAPVGILSENTLRLINNGSVKVYTWDQYQQCKKQKLINHPPQIT